MPPWVDNSRARGIEYDLRCARALHRGAERPHVKRTLALVSHLGEAPFWLVLLLQLALPSEIPGYVLGLARYSFPRYLLALSLAELPYTVATVYLGTAFLERRGAVILAAGLSVALLSVVAFYLLRRVMRPQAPEQHV